MWVDGWVGWTSIRIGKLWLYHECSLWAIIIVSTEGKYEGMADLLQWTGIQCTPTLFVRVMINEAVSSTMQCGVLEQMFCYQMRWGKNELRMITEHWIWWKEYKKIPACIVHDTTTASTKKREEIRMREETSNMWTGESKGKEIESNRERDWNAR